MCRLPCTALAVLLALLGGARTEPATVVSSPLAIAAFNVQRFGVTKMEKPHVMDLLTQILSRYDITLVQEIVDISETAIHRLTEMVANHTGLPYQVSLSPRVGRSSYEQYGYVYRSDRVRVVSEHMYPDETDVFSREPYIVTFAVDDVRHLSEFTLVGIHTQPSMAPQEIDALSDVLDYVETQLGRQNIIILGDFNAGCSYMTASEWAANRLRHRTDVTWTIADYTDTTVHATNCAYDRIVLKGAELSNAVVAGSFGPFRFDEEWGILENVTKDTSDHYPVHMKLKPKTLSAAERYLYPLEVFAVTDKRGVTTEEVQALATATDTASYTVLPLYNAQGTLLQVQAEYQSYKQSGDGILDTLIAFQEKFPAIVTDYDLGLLRYKIAAGAYSDPTVYEEAAGPRWFSQIICSAEDSASCMVSVEKRTLVA